MNEEDEEDISPLEALVKQNKRYKEALGDIISILEPLNSSHIEEHSCEGCKFEWNEALIIAMNVYSGLDPDAHYGAGYQKDKETDQMRKVIDAKYTTEQRYEAWRKAGFIQDHDDPKVWHGKHWTNNPKPEE